MSNSDEMDKSNAFTALQEAFDQTLKFHVSDLRSSALSEQRLTEKAEEEVSYGQVNVDAHGVTSGMRMAVFAPVEDAASRWRGLVSRFEGALKPFEDKIKGYETLEEGIAKIQNAKNENLEKLEEEFRENSAYEAIDRDYRRSEQRYNDFRDKYNNRAAVMFCRRWYYPIILVLLLLTEAFINYFTFLSFWNDVQIVACGTTIVIGILLALAAHLHGETIKQWSFLFSRSRSATQRASAWRALWMASFALSIVLGFTGWARYSVELSNAVDQSGPNVLGNVGMVAINPTRHVIIGLLANIGAWMVGLIISYAGHDQDPEYMSVTRQFEISQKAKLKIDKERNDRRIDVRAAADKAIEEKQNAVGTQFASVKTQIAMLKQVRQSDQAHVADMKKMVMSAAEIYRDVIIKTVLAGKNRAVLVEGSSGRGMTPFDYKNMQLTVDREV